jgi:transglutaminase-like putative cysteine protease
MRFHVIHRTICRYDSPVSVCHYHAKLTPRRLPNQQCPWHEITIHPQPLQRCNRHDSYGNAVTYFEIEGAHEELEVVSHSLVELAGNPLVDAASTVPWEQIRDACLAHEWSAAAEVSEFVCHSPLIHPLPEMRDYALRSFTPARAILAAALDLNHRLHSDFTFDPTATNVATPIDESWKKKRGVCQDFAQVMIACLRSIGLPARYVSGYLETLPPPGQQKLIGADASHAWLSLWCGDPWGWLDFDPTNDIMPSLRHITLAWGRDFSDVSPLRGVTLGAGNQKIIVAVDVSADGNS